VSRLAKVEAAYAAAAWHWVDARWPHENGVEDDGTPILCEGDGAPDCGICAAAAVDARAAENLGRAATVAARDGRWSDARAAARAARGIEQTWGDAPTWGPFCAAVEAAATATPVPGQAGVYEVVEALREAGAVDADDEEVAP